MSRLTDILTSKAREVDALRRRPRQGPARSSPLDVCAALRRGDAPMPRLIAEIKLRSPSAGPLSRALVPAARAVAYAEGGAAMVSVLCDAPFFDGSWDHVSSVRAALEGSGHRVPVLAKEFVVDSRQVEEARDRGADAVLLIARIVPAATLKQLADAARAEGLEPVLEVVDEREIDAALAAGGRVIGVNARDLDTLHMDAGRAARVLASIPVGLIAVHLSGVRDANDVARLADGRADAVLVGEALMREDDPRPLLRAMVPPPQNSARPGARG